jgi:hypothetical protein
MSGPTPLDLPAETRAAPARKIKPRVWILGGIGVLLVCATLTVGFFAVRAVKNAGLAFRFDPARKTLVMIGGDGKEFKISATSDGKPSLGMAAEPLRVENHHVDRKLPGCGDETNGCAHVEFTYVEVVGGPAAARERINAAIVTIMALETSPGDPKFTPGSYAQEYIDDAADNLKENPFSKGNFLSQPSGSTVSVNVIRNAAPVFSVACATTSYGGAHPNFDIHYLNLDPVTGEPIKLASIMKEGALARLTAIAEVHFREERKLATTAKLGDEGFDFPGGFALNDNYGFSEKALVFAFNPYEIASGGMGATLVEIPYAEIRDLFRPEFPL